MPFRDDLLKPIPGDHPGGRDSEELQTLGEIQAERRRDYDNLKSAVTGESGIPTNHQKILTMAQQALAVESKDLWLAAYLTEAAIVTHGVPGLTEGLQLMRGLMEELWDNLWPPLEGKDASLRAAPVVWLGNRFDPARENSPIYALMQVPLTSPMGYSFVKYRESQMVPKETDESTKAQAIREAAKADGKLTPEDFQKAFRETPKSHLRRLEGELKDAAAALEALTATWEEKHPKDKDGRPAAPKLKGMGERLAEIANTVRLLLAEKLKQDPDVGPEPVVSTPDPQSDSKTTAPAPSPKLSADLIAGAEELDRMIAAEIDSPQTAATKLAAVARYWRRRTPASPVSYLLLRALRWGEIRESGTLAQSLEAPPTALRTALRGQFQAKNWANVLELAESAMGQPYGRGWLDLQRYAVLASEAQGYQAVAVALRSELKTLLADFPLLPLQIMPDDTGAANPETIAWLEKERFWSQAEARALEQGEGTSSES